MDFVRALISCALRALGIGVLLYALVSLFSPVASAQDNGCSSSKDVITSGGCPDEGAAYVMAMRASDSYVATAVLPAGTTIQAVRPCTSTTGSIKCGSRTSNGVVVEHVRTYNTGQTCSSRNVGFLTDPEVLNFAGAAPTCVGGCKIAYGGLLTNKVGDMVVMSTATTRYYTGDRCPDLRPAKGSEAAEPTTKDQCAAAGDGQTFCITPKGDHCHTTSNGKRFCWSPTETGVKDDGVDAQRRSTDGNAAIPGTSPNEGQWQQRNQHAASITDATTGAVTTITITNFTSGGSKPDKPIKNPDITEPGEGSGEGNGNATPGVDCQTPPTCSGGDAIGCAMLRQQHALACGTGEPVADPQEGIGDGDVTAPVSSLWGSTSDPGFGDVNLAGWAGVGSCPIRLSFNAFGQSYTMEGTQLCELLDALRALINIVAAIHAAFIIAGGRR